ncbi:YhcH/YjgK/YiaL family protein [Parapedobacter koreensis]|uniref:YhcH/YjgK/YiaL family protein n=1 Tax=Parapedobacter koreensis TaxID=332977 RepID=A0A1H7PI76_9SPHI|nr:YhcH/YjgK/YiaL family protein [Parapedobacter koreensis]SEL35472.1 YhcH/YjgK/YiaL family protein [Parapedobacter koreensis]
MNNLRILVLFVTSLSVYACQQTGKDTVTSDEEINTWFERKEWLGNVALAPDPSINRVVFYNEYHQNKELWDKAFDYMATTDFDSLPVGEYPLVGKDLFVKVTAYETVDSSIKDYESHRQYTDIQFVVSGAEHIGLDNRDGLSIKTPYSEPKDIEFYEEKEGRNLLAQPGTFFIFFPSDAHRMGLVVGSGPSPVKKVVIKVKNKE